MSKSLEGKVALVTGCTKGLGKEIAFTFAREGAKVVINYYRDQATAESVYKELQTIGGEGILLKGNVSDEQSVNDMVNSIEDQLGPVDILVPNATPDIPDNPIENYTLKQYQDMIDFFIISPFLLTRAVVPAMKQKKWGRIINIGSEVYEEARPNFSAYVAAKGGQKGWTMSMAKELAPYGITVNLISPGWVPNLRHTNDPQSVKDDYIKTVPAGRWGTEADIADAALYFARDNASFVSGQTLCVNGARTPW